MGGGQTVLALVVFALLWAPGASWAAQRLAIDPQDANVSMNVDPPPAAEDRDHSPKVYLPTIGQVHRIDPVPRGKAKRRAAPKPQNHRKTDSRKFVERSTATIAGVFAAGAGGNGPPEDPNMAVGPSSVVYVSNSTINIYDKLGSTLAMGGSLESLLEKPITELVWDPRIVYDPHSERFFISAAKGFIDASTPTRIAIAVSKSSEPKNVNGGPAADADWWVYEISAQGNTDYPLLGVDQYNLYINSLTVVPNSADPAAQFRNLVRIIPKAGLLSGQAPQFFTYGLPPGPDVNSPSSSKTHLLGTGINKETDYGKQVLATRFVGLGAKNNVDVDRLVIVKVNDPSGTPTLSVSDLLLPQPYIPPQSSTGFCSNVNLAPRLVQGSGSLWVAFDTRSGSDPTSVRWYEIKDSGATSIAQSGEIADPNVCYVEPDIAVDACGNVAIVMAGAHKYAGSQPAPSVFFTTRRATDAAGFMSTPQVLKGGNVWPNVDRWGDYGGIATDPDTDQIWMDHLAITKAEGGHAWVGELQKLYDDNCTDPHDVCVCGIRGHMYDLEQILTTIPDPQLFPVVQKANASIDRAVTKVTLGKMRGAATGFHSAARGISSFEHKVNVAAAKGTISAAAATTLLNSAAPLLSSLELLEKQPLPAPPTPAPPVCGNGICEAGEEASTCPVDSRCGNGTCEAGETCANCPPDCGACSAECGNGTCDAGENANTCPTDCQPACGNGVCEAGEQCATANECFTGNCCCQDCGCNVGCGVCQAASVVDQPRYACSGALLCGNGVCDPEETAATCPSDCGAVCGDGVCEAGENCSTCAADCACAAGTVCSSGSCYPCQSHSSQGSACVVGVCDCTNGGMCLPGNPSGTCSD